VTKAWPFHKPALARASAFTERVSGERAWRKGSPAERACGSAVPCPGQVVKQRPLRIARQARAVQVGVQGGLEIVMAGGRRASTPEGEHMSAVQSHLSHPLRSHDSGYFVIRLGDWVAGREGLFHGFVHQLLLTLVQVFTGNPRAVWSCTESDVLIPGSWGREQRGSL
jgi:hypothetical protein